jgi:hypothetical protein
LRTLSNINRHVRNFSNNDEQLRNLSNIEGHFANFSNSNYFHIKTIHLIFTHVHFVVFT